MRASRTAKTCRWTISRAAQPAAAASASCSKGSVAAAGARRGTIGGPRDRPMTLTLTQSLLLIVALIALSAFFSLAEITLAASRRLRLRQMADEGDVRAERVLRVQAQPGHYFTVVQIGLNAVAI